MKALALTSCLSLLLGLLTPLAQAAPLTITDATGQAVEIRDASRIVAIGGAITETIYALGEEKRLIGVDSTSLWPKAASKLSQVGYQRTLGAEGILSLHPSLVLGTNQAGPPSTLEKLKAAGVNVLILQAGPDSASALNAILQTSRIVGRDAEGRKLVTDLQQRLDALEDARHKQTHKPGVLFVLSAANGVPLAAGRQNNANTMISLAGGRNVADAYEGYRPLNAESVIGLAPDAILVPEHVLHEVGGREKFLALPGLANTPAGRAGHLIVMDGLYLLGLGPRLADAVTDLSSALRAPHSADKTAAQ